MISMVVYLLSMFLMSIVAGLIGALVGIGGGILVTPILTLLFGVPVQYAIGASIVSVIGTSCGSACAFLRDGIINFNIGTLLNAATTTGAVLGAIATIFLIAGGFKWIIYLTFGGVLLASSYSVYRKSRQEKLKTKREVKASISSLSSRLQLQGGYYDDALKQRIDYAASGVVSGTIVMFIAGILSGLLGIGSGVLNNLAMGSAMKLPFKVSTTTSNFMIGVTAAASTAIFYVKGFVNLLIVGPVAVGVVVGALLGAKLVLRTKPSSLKLIFIIILVISGVEMIQKGVVSL